MLEGLRNHNLSMKCHCICDEIIEAGRTANLLSFACSLKSKPFKIELVFLEN